MGRFFTRFGVFWRNCNWLQKTTLTVSFMYVVVFITMLVLRPGSKTFYQGFQNTYQIIAPLWAGIACLVHWAKGRHETKSQKIAWFFLGLGCLSFAGGQTTWTVYESVLGQEVPFPGWADVGYLGSYPFLTLQRHRPLGRGGLSDHNDPENQQHGSGEG